MDTKEIINELNNNTKNKYSFVFKDATFDASTSKLLIEVFYSDGVILSINDRDDAEQYIISKLPFGFDYKVKFIKNVVTKDTIIPKIDEFFRNNMPFVVHSVSNIEKVLDLISITLNIDDKSFDYFKSKDGEKKLKQYLSDNFFTNFEIKIIQEIKNDVEIEEEFILPFDESESKEDRFIEVSAVEPLIGDIVTDSPKYIKDVLGKESQDICVCGNIKFFAEHSYERKTKKEPKPTDNMVDALLSEPTLRYYYKWVLEDFTGKIKCVCFTNKNTIEAVQSLEDGKQIVVIGDMEKDKFGDGYTLKIKRISTCVLPDTFEEKIEYKQENKL